MSRAVREGRRSKTALSLKDLAWLRQAAYCFFGAVLLYPDEEWMATLPVLAEGLVAESEPLSRFAFWRRWETLLRALARLEGRDRAQLETAYVARFLATSDGAPCVPQESAYFPREAVGWILAGLDREYARAGFAVAPSFRELPDHVAVELEFMGLLCGEEARAWRRRDVAAARKCLEREQEFLRRHLARWFPEFARRLRGSGESGFYALGATTAEAFFVHDLELVGLLLGRYAEVALP